MSSEKQNKAAARPAVAINQDLETVLTEEDGHLSHIAGRLRGVSQDISTAAQDILGMAERIVDGTGDPEGEAVEILTHCSFHDLAGQRLERLARELEDMEKVVLSVLEGVPVEEIERSPRDPLLQGPGGGGLAQNDIDSILGEESMKP